MSASNDPREVVVITGASGGIGAASARCMARPGIAFMLHYANRSDRADALAEELRAAGAEAGTMRGDMREEADIVGLFEGAAERFGHVTGAILSAGTDHPKYALEDLPADEIHRVLTLNSAALILGAREAVRRMPETGNRSIVNVSSLAGGTGGRPGKSLYAASKGAVDIFTQGVARELAPRGIRINSVRPGMTETDMIGPAVDTPEKAAAARATIPMQRFGKPEEIGETVAFLMSSKASFVTGAVIDIAGGGFAI
ncbi:SDR family oxidoreductase [Marivibrio halodurans]|uniref:SDR family oxidoreductase n=1 Tax=Marivibrio halodurans TaxID=2039722 RepID=A0A8J7S210_9PROT|nr:SDR family oxidoreductase [Marivibrio halodurans]MBP5857128.1 SDR family oxidoreductase [Marivibrio halodurans]